MTTCDEFLLKLSENQSSHSVLIGSAILLVPLVIIFGLNAVDLFNYNNFHEELRIIAHLDPDRTNEKDYMGQFLAAFPQPFLYKFLSDSAISLGLDFILFHKLLSFVCGSLMIAGGAVLGWRVGGPLFAAATAILFAAQPIYSFQINSAVPHAFAFPLLIWGLVCLIYDRPYMLAGLVVLSGLLYPPISPVLGLNLAWYLLVSRRCLSSHNATRLTDVAVLGAAGVISFGFLLHILSPIEGFGATVSPGAQADVYPENGHGGRHFFGVFKPLTYVFVSAFGQFRQELLPEVIVFLMIGFVGISVYGFYVSFKQFDLSKAILSFAVPSILFGVAIVLLKPELSYRFILYPLFTILPLLFGVGFMSLCDIYRKKLRRPLIIFGAGTALFVLSLNSFDAKRNGFKHQLDGPANALMQFLQGLPANSLVAAWPGGAQTSFIPYVAGRPLFVTFKAHYPSHVNHIHEMRARVNELIDAYLAADLSPLVRLNCRWHVDYLVVDQNHFTSEDKKPTYFSPFDKRIEKALANFERSKLILGNPPKQSIVFEANAFRVIDLKRISGGTNCSLLQ